MKNIKEIKAKLIERDGPRCAVSGEVMSDSNQLSIEHLIPKSQGGTDDLENLILVSNNTNAFIANNEKRRVELLATVLRNRERELTNREKESFEREQVYRKQIEQQKQELDEFRSTLQRGQSELERSLENEATEIAENRKRLSELTKALNEHALELKIEQEKLSLDFKEREQEILLEYQELEKEKEKYREETRRQIESRSGNYVNNALTALGDSAFKYQLVGQVWSVFGVLALIMGVVTGFYFANLGLQPLKEASEITWPQVSFFAFKGVLVIGLFLAIAKYCFSYGQCFLHEAIKNSERKHAINFGKFYLETFGAEAEWAQIKEAFEHWNINSNTAFSQDKSSSYDSRDLDKVSEVLDVIKKVGKESD